MSGDPCEPSADLRTAASAVRQMFIALVNEGFTESQALMLVRGILMKPDQPS